MSTGPAWRARGLGIAAGPPLSASRARVRRKAHLRRRGFVDVSRAALHSEPDSAPRTSSSRLGGQAIERVDDVQRLITHEAIGRPLAIRILRGDRVLDLEVSPIELAE